MAYYTIKRLRKAYTSDAYSTMPIECSAYKWNLYDVSSEDSGNTQNGQMQKMMLGQKTKLELEFQNISLANCSALLQLFNNEYTEIEYFDLYTNGYKTEVFYTGDRAAPLYNFKLGIVEKLTFNLIGRNFR